MREIRKKVVMRHPDKVEYPKSCDEAGKIDYVVSTDGASSNNGSKDPNKPVYGSWAYAVFENDCISFHSKKKDIHSNVAQLLDDGSSDGLSSILMYGGNAYPKVTNNQMEMRAVIEFLKDLKSEIDNPDSDLTITPNTRFVICSDSQIVVEGICTWSKNWKRNNWISSSGEEVANRDLWLDMLAAYDAVSSHATVEFCKVKGHSNLFINEVADSLAVIILEEFKANATDADAQVNEIISINHKNVMFIPMRVKDDELLHVGLFINNKFLMSSFLRDNPLSLFDTNLEEFCKEVDFRLYDAVILDSRTVFPNGGYSNSTANWLSIYKYYINTVL
jgi:ribonuclease HI